MSTKAEPSSSPPASWETFAAGYVSGCAGLLVGHPLDSLKVMLQASSPSGPPADATTVQGTRTVISPLDLRSPAVVQRRHLLTAEFARSAARRCRFRSATTTYAADGIGAMAKKRAFPGQQVTFRSLYNGIGAPLVTVGLVQSVSFASYEAFRRELHAQSGRDSNYRADADVDLCHVAIAAFASGALVSSVTGPLVGLKVRQQLTGRSLYQALGDAVRGPGGLRGIYAGYPAHFICDSLGRAVFFYCYEGIKARVVCIRNHGGEMADNVAASVPERMAAATISGTIACAVVFPFDAIRTRAFGQSARLLPRPSHSCLRVARDMWHDGGMRAFTRGFTVAAVRSGPVSAVAMPVYDLALDSTIPLIADLARH